MSGTGGADIVHGAGVPSPRWWRRYRDIPLVILASLSLMAAIVGWVTQYRIDSEGSVPASVVSTPEATADESAAVCRAPVDQPETQPWINGDPAAREIWEANASELEGPYVEGRDGWVVHNDQIEQNFSQAIGRRFLTVAEVSSWHDYFKQLSDALGERGIELSIQVTPSVTSVYPQQLPEWTDGIVGSTPLDQFIAASPDLPIVDFRRDLQEASKADAVYTPVNSHWTDWGGYIGWQTYARCHNALYPNDEPLWVPAVDGVESTRVYNEFSAYGVPDAQPAWTVPIFAETFADVEVTANDGQVETVEGVTTVDLPKLPASTTTQDAKTDRNALILRDSMGSALSPYWAQLFPRTWQIQHRYDNWSNPPNYRALVDQYQPDVVIVQLAERHLTNVPPAGVTSGF